MAPLVALGEAEVHLWRAPLDVDVSTLSALARPMPPDELKHAASYRFERDRVRWVAGRGWLRRLLACYIDADPAGLGFRRDASGKPRLAAPSLAWLRFNLARSDEIAVFAVARDLEVGVDVERLRYDFDMESMAPRFLSPREREAVSVLAPRLRVRACFESWTRKEACLKAAGVGLRFPLDRLDVGGSTRRSVRVPGTAQSAIEIGEWSLDGFDAGPGHVAAVAVEGGGVRTPGSGRRLDEAIASPMPQLQDLMTPSMAGRK